MTIARELPETILRDRQAARGPLVEEHRGGCPKAVLPAAGFALGDELRGVAEDRARRSGGCHRSRCRQEEREGNRESADRSERGVHGWARLGGLVGPVQMPASEGRAPSARGRFLPPTMARRTCSDHEAIVP